MKTLWRRKPGRRPTATTVLLAGLAAITLLLIASFLHRLVDITRGTPLHLVRNAAPGDVAPGVNDPRFVDLVSVLTGVTFTDGNSIEILASAETSYASLFSDMRAARRSITLQPYYCLRGRVADTTASILAERARAGVRVLMIADGFGCSDMPRRYGEALRAAGVELVVLRPVHWYTLHKAQHRSHVRVVVIDGAVAYTGGFGIDDKWLYGTTSSGPWRDTNVRFTGPAVQQAQAAFAVAWAEVTRELIAGEDFFVPADTSAAGGGALAGVQFDGPGLGTSSFERLLLLTITGARERLFIANAYFLPNRSQRLLLAQAARRGVDVRVLTAGDRSDVRTTRFASRASYDELLQAGVRVYEYQPAMMHAKTIVADGLWGAVGTMNFDNRSMRLGDELNLLFHDSALAGALESAFQVDLTHAREITRGTHSARPWRQRLLEQAARLVEPLM